MCRVRVDTIPTAAVQLQTQLHLLQRSNKKNLQYGASSNLSDISSLRQPRIGRFGTPRDDSPQHVGS
jgi:hypothetical protein